MRTTKYFLVKPAIAERAGVLSQRYRTADGLIVLNEQDMGKVRLQPEEYLTGVVEKVIDEREAHVLIEQGGRKMGIGQSDGSEQQANGEGQQEAVAPAEEADSASNEAAEDSVATDESVATENVEQECVTNNEAEEGLSDE